jgi:hypothetical protein
MSARIRYASTDLGETFKKSQRVFKAGKKSFYVVLNEDSMHYLIFDADTNKLAASGGNTTNRTVLRHQAKKRLEDLGVKFEGESRKNRRLAKVDAMEPETETQPESNFISRNEVVTLIETKVKEILGIIENAKSPEMSQENTTEMVG